MVTVDTRAMQVTLDSVLDSLSERPICFDPLGGNHGDTLIQLGSRFCFERYNINVVPDAERAEAFVVNGSGGLGVELYHKNMSAMDEIAHRFPSLPLIVLPSSFFFEQDRLAACFSNRSAPAYLFARDLYSFKLLESQHFYTQVQIGVADDMAFALRDSPLVCELKQRAHSRHILLVERFDFESPMALPEPKHLPTPLRVYTPGPLKRFAKKFVHRRRVAASTFTPQMLARLYYEAPAFRGLPVVAEDVSSTVGFTFDQFLNAIADAAVVVTTRLHVGILSALLNKPTYLVAGSGPWKKVQGVYEYSLANMPNVHLW